MNQPGDSGEPSCPPLLSNIFLHPASSLLSSLLTSTVAATHLGRTLGKEPALHLPQRHLMSQDHQDKHEQNQAPDMHSTITLKAASRMRGSREVAQSSWKEWQPEERAAVVMVERRDNVWQVQIVARIVVARIWYWGEPLRFDEG